MPLRRSNRLPVPALTPEERMRPLVDRPQNSNTGNMHLSNEATRNAPASCAERASVVVLEDTDEDQPPSPISSIGMLLEETTGVIQY
jgi:hypothetical protein